MTFGDAREGKWRGNWWMEWVASTLHTTSEHGASSITTADAHTSVASSRLNWRPRWFKWTRPFRPKTKSGFCACAITFQTQSTANLPSGLRMKISVQSTGTPQPRKWCTTDYWQPNFPGDNPIAVNKHIISYHKWQCVTQPDCLQAAPAVLHQPQFILKRQLMMNSRTRPYFLCPPLLRCQHFCHFPNFKLKRSGELVRIAAGSVSDFWRRQPATVLRDWGQPRWQCSA